MSDHQKIYLASDHAGFELKEAIKKYLQNKNVEIVDLGTNSADESVDYPDFSHKIAKAVAEDKNALGVLTCGSGIGSSMAANRHDGVRAALVTSKYMAQMAKRHNNANILVLGGRILGGDEANELVQTWLDETYEGGRHDKRLEKF